MTAELGASTVTPCEDVPSTVDNISAWLLCLTQGGGVRARFADQVVDEMYPRLISLIGETILPLWSAQKWPTSALLSQYFFSFLIVPSLRLERMTTLDVLSIDMSRNTLCRGVETDGSRSDRVSWDS